jgi:prepilin-type N-terminal cleavage/methylation domain-containing protein
MLKGIFRQPFMQKKTQGFTLLELMVVVAIIAGIIAIALPSIKSLSGLDVKREIVKIAGLCSEVYNLSSISGRTHRIVFDMDQGQYWVEEKEGDIKEINPDLGYEDLMKAARERNEKSPVDKYLPKYKLLKDIEKSKLPSDLIFYGIWTEDMKEKARSGTVYVYFFRGYTQLAFISVALKGDEEKSSMYLSLNPLTGEKVINMHEPDINELLKEEGSE